MSTDSGGFERFVPGGTPRQASHDVPVVTIGRHERMRFNWKAIEKWGLKDVETVTYYLDADTRRLGLSFDENCDRDAPGVYTVTDYDERGEVLSHIGGVLRSVGIKRGEIASIAHCLLRYDDDEELLVVDLAPVFAVREWETRQNAITADDIVEVAQLIEARYQDGNQYVCSKDLSEKSSLSATIIGLCCGELAAMGELEAFRETQKKTYHIPEVFDAATIATRVGAGGEA